MSQRYTPKQIKHKTEMKRLWRRAHPEEAKEERHRYYVKHPDRVKARKKRWIEGNREHWRAIQRDRQARVRAGGGKITQGQWESLVAAYKGVCAYCGEKKRLTIDHVMPLVHGGKHSIENIVPACKFCNSSKHAAVVGWEAPKRMMV